MAKRPASKKKRKQKKAVSEMMSVVAPEEPKVEAPVEVGPEPVVEPVKRPIGICGVCKKKRKQEITFVDCDEHWELPGHPDHIFRNVCVQCAPDYDARYKCSDLVNTAMRATFEVKGMSSYEVDSAIHVMWRSFWVELDDKALIKMARKLKVKHPWLKGKRAK